MITLPNRYSYLLRENAPKVLVEALKLFGTREIVGPLHSLEILKWAKELGMQREYTADEIPWCGLFVGVVVERADYNLVPILLRAKQWLKWGNPVPEPMLGDVVVFTRVGGGHVGFYVGEDATHLHILGGNQNNSVSIARFPKSAAVGYRRSPWRIGQPANVRKIHLSSTGILNPSVV
ncbi:TIGR02594 family protein [Hymenobacter aerilatus]|uniref:TIGR02594 family protein n=1 Tax=Hymenobacter aerilatus TaxID=2932251 RepID=A0A8T9T1U3_9BACT|nr:TIGR02594 family protein [Hymenobacter aerilatus]UOR07144.1 TIGR02594 family protein [Hymenobacter aerilatus]